MRPTWVEVDTSAVESNFALVRRALPVHAKAMAVVKADGYGHGAVPVALAAIEAGAEFLGVALVEEGIALRRAGIICPILYMEAMFPWQATDIVRFGITATVTSHRCADMLEKAATQLRRRARVHIKVDTGMGRLGLAPADIPGLADYVAKQPHLELEGVFTHLACAECDPEMTSRQLSQFADLIDLLRGKGYNVPLAHVANSVAAMSIPEAAFDMVRVGGVMYGLSPAGTIPPDDSFKPALSFHTRVSFVKASCAGATISYGATYKCSRKEIVVTLPVGYADGYSRALSGKGQVLIGGERRPIAGRVCMDQTMIALPEDYDVHEGDEVVLIGTQGGERILAEEIAAMIGTIGYEVVCSISKRVPRVYVRNQT